MNSVQPTPLDHELAMGKTQLTTNLIFDFRVEELIQQPLVDCAKVLLPPFHVKLGVMILFVWALDKDGYWFQYICLMFCTVTHDKLKADVCTGPQILNS
jgi:hypothetical protein